MDRRIGNFTLPQNWIRDNPDLVRDILKDVIVVRCELIFYSDVFEYTGLHEAFEEVPAGTVPLSYEPELFQESEKKDGVVIRVYSVFKDWRKL